MSYSPDKKTALAAIPLLLIAILLMVWENDPVVFEPPLLLAVLNTVFLGFIPLAIAYLAYRTFSRNGSHSILLLGCGMLAVGLGSMAAGWLNGLPQGSNITPTIHNMAVLAGGLLIFLSGVLIVTGPPHARMTKGSLLPVLCYGAIALFIAALTIAVVAEITPLFFVQGTGPTAIRQVVLSNALLLFSLSSILFALIYRRRREDFHFWFSLSLAFIAIGLFAIFFQHSVGSLVGWTGRIAQYAGACLAILAIAGMQSRAEREGIPVQDLMMRFFASDTAISTVISAIDDAVFLLDPVRTLLMVNPVMIRKMGKVQPGEMIGHCIDEFFEPSIAERRKARIDEVLRTKKPLRFEDGRDGMIFDNRFFPVLDGEEVSSVLVISRDITARRKAEDSLRENEERLSLSVSASGQAMWDYDVLTDTTIASDRMLEIYGIAPTHSLRTQDDWHTMILEEDLRAIRRNIEGADPATGAFHTEFRIRRGTDGAIRWIASSGKVIRDADGREVRRIGVLSDITERKNAEEALVKSTEELRQARDLLEAVTAGTNVLIATVDENLRYTYFNRSHHEEIRRLTGKETVLGMNLEDVLSELPGDRDAALALWRRALDGETIVQTMEFGEKSRYRRWYSTRHAPVRNASGAIIGAGEVTFDITPQKTAEAALKKSRTKLAEVLDSIQDNLFSIDRDLIFVFVSRKFVDSCGMKPEDMLGRNIWDVFPKHRGTILDENIRAVMETGEIRRFEVKGQYSDTWFSSTVFPSEEGVTVLGVDITGSKKADEALRKSEQRLRSILDNSLDALYRRDLVNDRFEYFSPVIEQITGYSQQEILAMSAGDVLTYVHPDDLPRVMAEKMVPSEKGLRGVAEYRFRCRDGTYIWLSDKFLIISNATGIPVAREGIVRDIHLRKKAEDALLESELRYRIVADNALDWVFWIDNDGKILYTSPSAERILGRAVDGYTQIRDLIADVVHPGDHARWLAHLGEEHTENNPHEMEFRIIRPGGEVRWIHHTCRAVCGERGSRLGIRGSNRDVTRLKEAEEKLRASLAEKDILLREIHHRVKNNLQIISGLLDMTRTRAADETTRAILTDMMVKIQTMAHIHTRMYEGQEYGNINMGRQVMEQISALNTIYAERDRPIDCEIITPDIFLPVDQAIPCALVISEILSNAFKHAFRGRSSGEIAIAMNRQDGNVRISIRDNGIGMPPGSEAGRSNSLGMKLIRTLVQQQLKGTLSITNRDGTEIVMEFPAGEGGVT